MRCPSCALDNDPSNQFCARCNTAIQATAAPGVPPTWTPPGTPGPVVDTTVGAAPTGRRRTVLTAPMGILVGAVIIGVAVVVGFVVSGGRSTPPSPTASGVPATADTPGTASPTSPGAQPTGSAEPEPTAPAATAQVLAMDAILDASAASRRKLQGALDKVWGCRSLTPAIRDIEAVGGERQAQLTALDGLDLSAVPEGERLRALLRQALTYSLDADRSYLLWAQASAAGGCPGSGAVHRDRGDAQSGSAGQNKVAFIAAWNPVATRWGLPQRTRDDI